MDKKTQDKLRKEIKQFIDKNRFMSSDNLEEALKKQFSHLTKESAEHDEDVGWEFVNDCIGSLPDS